MSDVEDGELVSSDDDSCTVKGEDGRNVKSNDDKKSNVKENNNSQWNYEQNNIRMDASFKQKDSKNNYEETNRSKTRQRSDDRERKRIHEPRKHIEIKRHRKSDNLEAEHIKDNVSIDDNDSHKFKRRILCKYYAAGDCKNGSTCAFMHEDFPCKFFHDESTTCRAGNNCKYSHETLSDEMKLVLDGFIHEGKEKSMHTTSLPTFKNESFITNHSPPPLRPNCLLPTPVMAKTEPISSYDPDFTESYQDISNYPSNKYIYDTIPNYPIANKAQFLQTYPKPGTQEFQRRRASFNSRNYRNFPETSLQLNASFFSQNKLQRPLLDIENSDDWSIYNEWHSEHSEQSFASNEENIVPDVYNDIKYVTNKQLNCKIHAPARFIVGNQLKIKTEPEYETSSEFDVDFKAALKQLAEQVVVDPFKRSPSCEKSGFDEKIENNPINSTTYDVDTSNILKNMNKVETLDVKTEDMSESEKMYMEEMKSLINLNAQFENVIPWVLKSLEPIQKQPYVLYLLRVNEIHDNPLADPRLIGHPVLNFLVKKEYEEPIRNEEVYTPLSIIKEEEVNTDNSDDSRSYLYSSKFRKRKVV